MKAYELLEQKGWCQGYYAHTAEGIRCGEHSRKAASFCLMGALHATKDHNNDEFTSAFIAITHKIDGESIAQWNDAPGRTKEEVVKLLRSLDI